MTLRRAGGYAAIVAPAMMWTGFVTAALARPGYNVFTRPFSDLATRGTSNSTVFDVGFFIVPGALTALVGLGLWFAGDGRGWRAGAALVCAVGLFLIATGVFQQDPGSSSASILHGTVSQTCFAIASVAPFVLFLASSRDAGLQTPRQIWLATGVAAASIEIAGVALRPILHYPDGLFQRPFTVALTIWFLATGAWLLRVRKAEGLVLAE